MNIIDYVIIFIVIIFILILITVLSNVFPKIILVFIITLFIVSFIFNTYELFNYTNESTKIGSNKLLSYCNLGTYKLFNYDLKIKNSDIQLLIIYFILFILLWSNTITNLITNNLSSEIKILGFYKYYNRDIYENYNYEHSILWAIMIFVAYSFIIYLFNLINLNLINFKNIDVVSHINILNKTIKDNTSCNYLEYYITEVDKKTGKDEEIFKGYYALGKSKYKDDKDLYLKCYITYHLFGLEKREMIKYDNTFCKDDNYCIFNLLKGKDVYSVFPDKFKPLKFMENVIYTGGKTFATDSNDIEKNYNQFISTLHNSYSYLKSHERYNSFYYKLDLLFAKLSGMIFSIIAIIFFIKTEFKQFIKNKTGIIIDPLEYTIEIYNIMIKGLILFITIIFISILFNT